MSKNGAPPSYNYGPPPAAPPSYAQAVGGVPPTSPYIPHHSFQSGPEILTTVVPLGPNATHMICPHCHAEIDTTTKTQPGLIAYISGLIICLTGCPFGCCLIPCCIDKCMDVHHSCPNCDTYLGRYKR
ncbi:cell death-inducing p53-target protein 1 isoform X2 [Agrilus planipennis]|uniref:Cell death-inducing p53-target protein 1 isoform X2 n=1 Tax=Agrilus planipennis TaxID=224129 RepID=A0A7F5R976_AGRPL|nr:cell death-inducing p53-target protein 1 isoform X2 [Agrilus planipennis]